MSPSTSRSTTLCVDLLERYGYRCRSLDLRATEVTPRSSMNDLAGTPPTGWLTANRPTALELEWLNLRRPKALPRSLHCHSNEKQRLFAWCIAASLKPQLAIEDRADPVLEGAGRRLSIGFEDYWRPTAANYWGRVKKAHGLAIGREILGERWARDHADDKKPVLAAALETAFDAAEERRLHRSRPRRARHSRGLDAARHRISGRCHVRR